MRTSSRSRCVAAVASLALALAGLGLSAGSALAVQRVTHEYSSSFDGTGSTAGPFSRIASIAVDEVTGTVYVATEQSGLRVDKFNAAGVPESFSAPGLEGATSLNVGASQPSSVRIAVDNSHTATQGRIYVSNDFIPVQTWAFEPDGTQVGGNFPIRFVGGNDIAVDPASGDLWVAHGFPEEVDQYTPDGVPTEVAVITPGSVSVTDLDSSGNVYAQTCCLGSNFAIFKYNPAGQLQYALPGGYDFSVDPVTDDLYTVNPGTIRQWSSAGAQLMQVAAQSGEPAGIAVNGANRRVYVAKRNEPNVVDVYDPGPTVTLPGVTTEPASEFQPTTVKLNGTVDPDGEATTDCHFEWSSNYSFNKSMPCAEGNVFTGSGGQHASVTATGLTQGQTYNYRLVVANANETVIGPEQTFVPSAAPTVGAQWGSEVHSDSALLHSDIDPGGASTTYHFQYGTEDCSVSSCSSTANGDAGKGLATESLSLRLNGLESGTTYHYRVVAINQSGTTYGTDHTFVTFPFTAVLDDTCPNAHVRQQVGAALLPDCRAYELVSAADTGGYNVESSLVADQSPFDGYPGAEDPSRVLYGIHSGAIPGLGNPTNRGVDPYVATRGPEGWTSAYVGMPADNSFTLKPFSSSLDEANASLTTFAFGGSDICSPCFGDGSTGLPLHEPDGSLVQGMAGAIPQPGATSDGLVKKRFSADGSHLVFGSTSRFEADGNDNTGDVSIYDRNPSTGVTQVVSKSPSGQNLACLQGAGQCHSPGDGAGIAELDISSDGSRIVVGQLVSTDASGNHYFHLYMHVGTSPDTIDLTPGTTSGAQYDGMTADGSQVFFTTKDPLATPADQDTDTSADIFRADVSSSSATLTRISTGSGGTGNTDECDPPENWNVASGVGGCSALAFAGGAGVAAEGGTFYFLSPEKLDSSDPENQPVQDQANLYAARPGSGPHFVATIDSSEGKPGPQPPSHPLENAVLVGGLNRPESLAVDQSNGDIYVSEAGNGTIDRFKSNGEPRDFTAASGVSGNQILGQSLAGEAENQIAIDNASGSPLEGDLYVTTNGGSVRVFANSGEEVGSLEGFGEACGVAVDDSNGAVYVGDYSGTISRFEPTSNSMPVSNSDYTVTSLHTEGLSPCQVGADSAGHAFGVGWSQGPIKSFSASEFEATPPTSAGTEVDGVPSFTDYTDPLTAELFVDEGNKIAVFDSSGTPLQTFGDGDIFESRGVAVNGNTKHVYASTGSHVIEFGAVATPYFPIDNPAARHAVSQAETHNYGDFQVTTDGQYAAFSSLLPLTGYDNAGRYEVFRYDDQHGSLVCASCNPTGARAEGGSTLSATGLGLTDDGHVFFNSNDAIAPRDLDSRQDAYEWDGNSPQLISTGSSPFDSSLLGASADGADAYFFTRDVLVPQDKNGSLVKVYDARAGGGFSFLPPHVLCKASDECHGAGSPTPGPLPINTITGTSGEKESAKPKRCRKGLHRQGGHCVRSHHHRHRHRAHHKRSEAR